MLQQFNKMTLTDLPLHVVSQIICTLSQNINFAYGQNLRLVNRLFDQEILHAYFELDIASLHNSWSPSEYPRINCLEVNRLSTVRFLRGFISRNNVPEQHAGWRNSLRAAARDLPQFLTGTARDVETCEQQGNALYRMSKEALCEAVVHMLGIWKTFQSTDSRLESYLEICRRPPSYWVVMTACYRGSLDDVRNAIKHHRRACGFENASWTESLTGCLYLAASSGRLEVVRLLLDMGISPNDQIYDPQLLQPGNTAVEAAAELGLFEIIDLLLERGLEKTGPSYGRAISIMIKTRQRSKDERADMVDKMLVDSNDLEWQHCTSRWLVGATHDNNLRIIKSIFAHAQQVDRFQRISGHHPLFPTLTTAASNGYLDILHFLLNERLTFHERGQGHTKMFAPRVAATHAFKYGQKEALAMMEPYVYGGIRSSYTLIKAAGYREAGKMLSWLVEGVDLDEEVESEDLTLGQKMLNVACEYGNLEGAEFLLQRGYKMKMKLNIMFLRYTDKVQRRQFLAELRTLLEKYGCPPPSVTLESGDEVDESKPDSSTGARSSQATSETSKSAHVQVTHVEVDGNID